jgi:magnesium chelatase family protein
VPLGDAERDFMNKVATRMNLSARAYDRILKVARTLADLAARDQVGVPDLAEAVQYRHSSD